MIMSTPSSNSKSHRSISVNRKAYHDYEIIETYEVGLVLVGTEVKSIRAGQVNLRDNYATVSRGEVFVHHMHISPYSHGNRQNHDPLRVRKLMMHKKEIRTLIGKTQQEGLTLVVTKLYWKGNRIKAELALAKGKKLYDKRQSIAERDTKRQIERLMRRDG